MQACNSQVFVSTLQVGSADALAFYLPGVVSQLGKVLHTSRSMISGAAGSTKALDQAVRALAEFLVVVLKDGVSSPHGAPMEDITVFDTTKEKPLTSFLEELRLLPAKKMTQHDISDPTESVEISSIIPGGDSMPNVRSLHVNRTKEWLASTVAHVNKLLSATFPLVRLTRLFLGIVCTIICRLFLCLIWNSFSLFCSFAFILAKK